jgi:site-specific DNA-methyltransferase (adenine-specific)
MHKITNANIKEWAANYDGELFDGILCDPPYELGFMGKSWDSSGIAFDTEMWADLFKLVKPGGHLLAFSGSRTYHRMAVAIEDAGFEIRDMIEWVYGSGFPKSLNIGKAVDKIQGNEREVTGTYKVPDIKGDAYGTMNDKQGGSYKNIEVNHTKGNSPYEGYGTALKPAHEPCVLARKPLDKGMTVATNVLKHGTGGLNIDGSRIQTTENLNGGGYNTNGTSTKDLADATSFATKVMDKEFVQPTGRFPANLIHDGSDEVEAVFPQKAEGKDNFKHSATSIFGSKTVDNSYNGNSKSSYGSASRFFYCAKSSRAERNAGLDGAVSVKVQLEICENNTTRQENLAQLQVVMDNSHLKATAESGIGTKSGTEWSMSLFGNQHTEKYLTSTKSTTSTTTSSITTSAILNYLTGLLTNENTLGVNLEMENGGNPVNDVESSSTLTATISDQTALALGVNPAQASKRLLISVSDGKNFHSTVKPLALTKYLATLIKPPTGGRLLVPFSGSGSEMIGALQAGWEYVEGVELTEEYIPIAEARIKYWLEQEAKKQPTLL